MYPVSSPQLEIVAWSYLLPCLALGIEGPDGIDIIAVIDVVEGCGPVSIGQGGVAHHVPAGMEVDGFVGGWLSAVV